MFSSVTIDRVRSIHHSKRVTLRPLTVIVGPNGSGKSSFLRALELCKSTVHQLTSGPNQAVRARSGVVSLPHEFYASERYAVGRRGSQVAVDIIANRHGTASLAIRISDEADDQVTFEIRGGLSTVHGAFETMCYLSESRFFRGNRSSEPLRRELAAIAGDRDASARFLQLGKDLFDVDWWRLLKDATAPGYVDLAIGRSGILLPVHMASLGTRQFLDVAARLLAMPRGGTLIVEEPEVSLHPRAQVRAGEMFAEATSRDRQVILATHSHYMLLGVLKQVRDGVIASRDLAILNCRKTAYGTEIERLDVEADGSIEAGIPSFADVDQYLFNDWIRAMPQVSA